MGFQDSLRKVQIEFKQRLLGECLNGEHCPFPPQGEAAAEYYKRLLYPIWGPPWLGNRTPTINQVYLDPYQVERTLTVNTIAYFRGSGALAGGERVIMGIYRDNGDTPTGGALLASTGSVLCAAGTDRSQEIPIGPIQLTGGLYWSAIVSNMGTVNLLGRYSSSVWNVTPSTLHSREYSAGAFTLLDPCPATSRDGYSSLSYMFVSSIP